MPIPGSRLRSDALAIWQAALAAVEPAGLVRSALLDPGLPLAGALAGARRILVVGAGKAGAAMSAAVEEALPAWRGRLEGWVNVPADSVRQLSAIHLHAARPAASNQPTAAGVDGSRRIAAILHSAGPEDVALCLLSGGGSALLPDPVEGITLEDKQVVTLVLHASGATINEMNAVRKHLSACKGGRLAQAFAGQALFSLIISDVVGDPLDVIASGPTAADPTTFADALAVLRKFQLETRVPAAVFRYLQAGAAAARAETLKAVPGNVRNFVIGNNSRALAAARNQARQLGYAVINLGSYIEGETREVATAIAGIARSIQAEGIPLPAPACLLSGGETTVTLRDQHGLGGRNQEFVLAACLKLGRTGLANTVVLSGGTDGEDGPTDAAGAVADTTTWDAADRLKISAADYLARNDSYRFFAATDGLIKTGLTQTNVMDVRVILVS